MREDEVAKAIHKVLLKFNLAYTSIRFKSKRGNTLAARKEIAYVLVAKLRLKRKEVGKILKCKSSLVSYLIRNYCAEHRLTVPKRILSNGRITIVANFISDNEITDVEQLEALLTQLYYFGYNAGHTRASRFEERRKRGVPRVASPENNAPVSFLEAPTGLLNGVEDDQERTERSAETAHKAI